MRLAQKLSMPAEVDATVAGAGETAVVAEGDTAAIRPPLLESVALFPGWSELVNKFVRLSTHQDHATAERIEEFAVALSF